MGIALNLQAMPAKCAAFDLCAQGRIWPEELSAIPGYFWNRHRGGGRDRCSVFPGDLLIDALEEMIVSRPGIESRFYCLGADDPLLGILERASDAGRRVLAALAFKGEADFVPRATGRSGLPIRFTSTETREKIVVGLRDLTEHDLYRGFAPVVTEDRLEREREFRRVLSTFHGVRGHYESAVEHGEGMLHVFG